MTKRLYLDEPWLGEFDAVVTAHGNHLGRPSVALDQTAFYPEAGGQAADHGSLGAAVVLDVQAGAGGEIHHVVDGVLPAVGARVRGVVDWPRRREHMALHTGQHMLSQSLLRVAAARTVSSRLGEHDCTIDVDCGALSLEQLDLAEQLLHAVIDADVPIQAWVPRPDELAAMPLRRSPKVEHEVRVVRIGDYDVTPCGGTHCSRSGQVGLVRVLQTERYKGKVRVHFVAGPRARRVLFAESRLLRELGRERSASPAEVPAAVGKLERELGWARRQLVAAHTRLGTVLGTQLRAAASGPARVIATLDDAPLELLRATGAYICREPGTMAMLAGRSADEQRVVVCHGRDVQVHCGRLLSRVAKRAGGQGGGGAAHAEGRLPWGAQWDELVAAALREG